MEDSMDMDMSPLRPQNYLFGCELKADKDYHFKVIMMKMSTSYLKNGRLGAGAEIHHQWCSIEVWFRASAYQWTALVAVEEDAESEDEEEEV
ncbi:Nucleophosmin [Plecturocebus cupreus]